jgi:microcystin-dependent protein
MADPFIGEIKLLANTFAPRQWAECRGQTLSIAQNTALFSLLGTTFGGDGVTSFCLPNLQGRVAVGSGEGPGTSYYEQGKMGGAEQVAVRTTHMPAHAHTISAPDAHVVVNASTEPATSDTPHSDSYFGKSRATTAPQYKMEIYGSGGTPDVIMTSVAEVTGQTGSVGANQYVNTVMPCLGLIYCIALAGVYPSRPT